MFKQWLHDNRAQAMTEYGLLLALVAVALVTGVVTFRGQIETVFANATAALQRI